MHAEKIQKEKLRRAVSKFKVIEKKIKGIKYVNFSWLMQNWWSIEHIKEAGQACKGNIKFK